MYPDDRQCLIARSAVLKKKMDPLDRKRYMWDVMSFGAPIQRGRNFFRGHLDREEVSLAAEYFPAGWGP